MMKLFKTTPVELGILLVFLLAVACCGCNSRDKAVNQRVGITIETGEGEIEIELYGDKAPASTKAILAIIDQQLYDNSSFYRVLNNENQPSADFKSELLQGGLWSRTKKKPELPAIPHESTKMTGLRHLTGSVSLARLEPGTATSEFFICMADDDGLDFGGKNNADGQGYAVIGKVTQGMDVVRKIYRKPESDQYFDPPVPIFSIRRN
jgi:peptidyl-prolyl cis-trans isomerase A (cyclophilin A)